MSMSSMSWLNLDTGVINWRMLYGPGPVRAYRLMSSPLSVSVKKRSGALKKVTFSTETACCWEDEFYFDLRESRFKELGMEFSTGVAYDGHENDPFKINPSATEDMVTLTSQYLPGS